MERFGEINAKNPNPKIGTRNVVVVAVSVALNYLHDTWRVLIFHPRVITHSRNNALI
jgi:hypothetical protein